jgi:hypothetical protein
MEILGWFLIEAFGAATLVALLVWWSWPRKPDDKDSEDNGPPG